MKKSIATIASIICIVVLFCSCAGKITDTYYGTFFENLIKEKEADGTLEMKSTADTVEATSDYVEPSGVPDSVILRNVSLPENTTYEIVHNYDASSHIDDALLMIHFNSAFGSETETYSYAYQYNRSTDLWELLDESNGQKTCSISFDKEAYLTKSPFTGSTNDYHNCTYSISVLDIDIENMNATIRYSLHFSRDSIQDLNSSATVELWYADDGDGPYFEIPYTRSIVVQDRMYFMLSIDEGIRFVQ